MVNEKQTKRERNIRSKLMAAIAMLLVSSIMMVSTTYAWFTLSTAPEVTGITTNIASNGNLEIALSPASGVGTEVGNATTGNTNVVSKNLTWGNLVDMSDASYNLGNLTLAPSTLYITMTGTEMSLGSNVLATPTYGADGRISGLTPNAFIASKSGDDYVEPGTTSTTVDGVTTTTKNPHTFGVRAVGTSSGLSAQASTRRTARATMTSEIAASISAASRSLTETGAALAEMMITHAMATGADNADYSSYKGDLQTLITELNNSVTSIDKALKAYLTAAATTIADETVFNTVITEINKLVMAELDASSGKITVAGQEITVPNEFALALAARKTIKTNIDAAQAKLNAVTGTSWTDYSPVLNCLLNTSGANAVKINGKTMADIETMDDNALYPFAISMLRDATIELYDGSGLYYDLAEISGNIVAVLKGVQIEEINKGGIHLTNVEMERVTIKTAVPSSQAIHLTTLQAQTNGITAAASSGAIRVDTNYGYIIDLMVRTNAADTKLMLQTEGAQRVYGESNSSATMGNGTSFVFKTYNYNQVASLQNLLTSIRAVFFDPTQDTNKVLGLAKVVSAPVVTSVVVGTEIVDGTAVDIVEYTVTGYLELCNIVSATATDGSSEVALTATGTCYAGSAKTDDQTTPGFAENDVLCELTQNQAQPISVMVYLDGTNVTSADVLADESVTGALNLQFRSSADLAPMENSDLMNMVAYNVTKGVGVTGTDKVLEGVPYSFTLAEGYKLKSITIKGEAMTNLPAGDTSRHYSIDATSIKGDIVIVTEKIASAQGDSTEG